MFNKLYLDWVSSIPEYSLVALLHSSYMCAVVFKNKQVTFTVLCVAQNDYKQELYSCNEKHNFWTLKMFLCLMSVLTCTCEINNHLKSEQWKYGENYDIMMESDAIESISRKNNSFIWQCFDITDVLLSLETFRSVFVINYFNPYYPNRITNIEKIWCAIVSH